MTENSEMTNRKQTGQEIKLLFIISLLILCVVINIYACQNKRPSGTMTEKEPGTPPADTGRLLTVANLELADSGKRAIAWFFETPQVFELILAGEQAKQFFSYLNTAKENQWPVRVHSTSTAGKNMIDLVVPATAAQVERNKKEKAGHQPPQKLPPPPHR